MFVGLSGVAVLSAGVFAVPALRRIGYDDATMAAFIAVMATAGMIAPPMNVPAMLIADGVNMPWTNTTRALLALALPLAAAALVWFRWWQGPTQRRRCAGRWAKQRRNELRGMAPLVLIVADLGRRTAFPATVLIDPASPLILVIGGLAALPMLPRERIAQGGDGDLHRHAVAPRGRAGDGWHPGPDHDADRCPRLARHQHHVAHHAVELCRACWSACRSWAGRSPPCRSAT